MGTYGQSVTLANSIIGVGILAMPFCFHQCGVILATLMLLGSGLVSRLTCHFLLKSAIMSRRRNFEFLAFHVFGSAGKFAVEIGIIGFLMGTCIAYFVVVGDLGPQIIAKMFNINQSDVLRSSVMVMVSVVCVLPLGLLRNVDSLGNVSAATIGFYVCLVLKIIGEATSQIFAGDWLTKVDLWKPEGLLQCVPIFSMALFCQTQLFEIFEPLPNISLDKMNVVTKNAINICTSVYILVGLFGYIAFSGQPISGNILVNMSATMASDVIKIGFVMSLAFSFPLIIFPCRASLYSLLYRRGHTPHYEALNHPIPMYRFRTLTVAIVCTTLLVSLAVPNVALVLGLLGSTVGVAVCVIFPATCFICISFKNTNERILAQVIWCFGILMMVLGTYANLQAAESQLNTHLSADIQHIPKHMENVDKEINADSLSIPEILQKKEKSIADESESLIQPPNPVAPMADKVKEPAKIDSIHNADIALPANSDDSFVQPPVLPDLDSEVQPKNPVPPDSDSEVQPKNPVAPDSDSEVQPKNPVARDSEVQPINPVAPDTDSENHLQNAVAPIIEAEVLQPNEKAPILATDEQKKLDSSNSDPKTIPAAQNLNTGIESQKNVLTDNAETKKVMKTEDIMVPRVVMGDNQENILTDLPPQKVVGSNRTNILKSIEQNGEPIKENVDTIVQHAIANEEKLDKIKQETLIETMKKQGEEQKEILQEQKKILKEIQESLQIKKKDENNSQNPEETKKQAVESIQKIAEQAIKRLEKISSKATTAEKKSDSLNQRVPISKKEQSNSPQEGSLTKHVHKPDEPESYIRGEDSEKAEMSAANMKAIVDKVPIPIALRNTQQETEQVKNSGEPKPDNGPEFHINGADVVLNKSKVTPKIEEEKIVQGNIYENDVLSKEHHFIRKREIVDCTLTSNISEEDKRICETIMSSKDNRKEGIDVELSQLSVPDVDSVLAELKNSDSLNSVMLNNIDLVHFKSRNLKTTDDETNPG